MLAIVAVISSACGGPGLDARPVIDDGKADGVQTATQTILFDAEFHPPAANPAGPLMVGSAIEVLYEESRLAHFSCKEPTVSLRYLVDGGKAQVPDTTLSQTQVGQKSYRGLTFVAPRGSELELWFIITEPSGATCTVDSGAPATHNYHFALADARFSLVCDNVKSDPAHFPVVLADFHSDDSDPSKAFYHRMAGALVAPMNARFPGQAGGLPVTQCTSSQVELFAISDGNLDYQICLSPDQLAQGGAGLAAAFFGFADSPNDPLTPSAARCLLVPADSPTLGCFDPSATDESTLESSALLLTDFEQKAGEAFPRFHYVGTHSASDDRLQAQTETDGSVSLVSPTNPAIPRIVMPRVPSETGVRAFLGSSSTATDMRCTLAK
jgi:hypothetical protein